MTYNPNDPWQQQHRATTPLRPDAAIDAGLRAFMLRVYGYMAFGLAFTGIVAYAAAASGRSASRASK